MPRLNRLACVLTLLACCSLSLAGEEELFKKAAGLEEADVEALQASLGDGEADGLDAALEKLEPAFAVLGDLPDEPTLEWGENGFVDPPAWYEEGANPLYLGLLARLAGADAGDDLNTAAREAIAMRRLLRTLSQGPGTQYWFDAAGVDSAIMQRLALRMRELSPEVLELASADLPPLRPFPDSTGEEGEALAQNLRESDGLPQWVLDAAERREVGDAELEQWKADWADDEQKARLIREYELYFAVEVELANKRGTREFDATLADWEAAHEAESLWLARNTLMSPRFAYTTEASHEATQRLFAAAVAGVRTGDLPAAARAAGVRLVRQEALDFLVADNVPLNDEPVFVAIERE